MQEVEKVEILNLPMHKTCTQTNENVQGHVHIKGSDGFKLWTHKHAQMTHRDLDCGWKKKKKKNLASWPLPQGDAIVTWN